MSVCLPAYACARVQVNGEVVPCNYHLWGITAGKSVDELLKIRTKHLGKTEEERGKFIYNEICFECSPSETLPESTGVKGAKPVFMVGPTPSQQRQVSRPFFALFLRIS